MRGSEKIPCKLGHSAVLGQMLTTLHHVACASQGLTKMPLLPKQDSHGMWKLLSIVEAEDKAS